MPLLELPEELIALIAHCIGPSELRKSVDYLLVAKRWYRAVLPVYLSQLPLSDLYLALYRDLEILPSPDTRLSSLIREKAKRLSVRLVGYPSKCPSVAPWHDNTDIGRGQDGMKKWVDWHCDWSTSGREETHNNGDQNDWHRHKDMIMLHPWGGIINKKLVELAAILSGTQNLEEFSLEASREDDTTPGPRWDYIHDFTIQSLLVSFPSSLNNLTLDLGGSRFIAPERDRDPVHLCPLIAERLHDFQKVRLRLRCICPEIFQPFSSNTNAESRLRTLIVRLSLPYVKATNDGYTGDDKFDAKPCDMTPAPLYKRMSRAGVAFKKNLPRLSMMRISYRYPNSISLRVVDCVRERQMFEGSEVFFYEDDGTVWDAWEETSPNWQDLGSIRDLLR